jgi:hypothetical protein
MKKNELEQRLLKEHISAHFYSLKGGLPNEALCLNEGCGKWEVYYSERGMKTGLKSFKSEEDACNYFYTNLIESLKDMGLI